MFFRNKIINFLKEIINTDIDIEVEKTRIENFGDFSTNIAMKLSKIYKKSPISIAEELVPKLDNDFFSKVEVVEPGFINFFLSDKAFLVYMNELKRENFKNINIGNGKKVLIEYGSINPTGPLHVGHGRVIIVGDVVSNFLRYIGFDVTRDYYLNDNGNQIDNLTKSVYLKYKEILGFKIELPDEIYMGDYVKEIAKDFISYYGMDKILSEDNINIIKDFSLNWCISNIKNTLEKIGVIYNNWVSERELYESYKLENVIEKLREKNLVYEREGALWCQTTLYGDSKDRVVLKSDGSPAYYTSDIVYSMNKSSRGFNNIITILGFDHHGYVKRLESSFLFNNIEQFKTILVQMVQLFRGEKLVKMSKRAGEFYTLNDLIEEIGEEVCRISFLTRNENTPLDFDIELAKEQSDKNPAHYIQYACVRISSILRKNPFELENINFSLINLKEEKDLLKKIDEFYLLLKSISKNYDVHLMVVYLKELSSLFHSYYNSNVIISAEKEKSKARVFLISKVREVIVILLDIIGIKAAEKM